MQSPNIHVPSSSGVVDARLKHPEMQRENQIILHRGRVLRVPVDKELTCRKCVYPAAQAMSCPCGKVIFCRACITSAIPDGFLEICDQCRTQANQADSLECLRQHLLYINTEDHLRYQRRLSGIDEPTFRNLNYYYIHVIRYTPNHTISQRVDSEFYQPLRQGKFPEGTELLVQSENECSMEAKGKQDTAPLPFSIGAESELKRLGWLNKYVIKQDTDNQVINTPSFRLVFDAGCTEKTTNTTIAVIHSLPTPDCITQELPSDRTISPMYFIACSQPIIGWVRMQHCSTSQNGNFEFLVLDLSSDTFQSETFSANSFNAHSESTNGVCGYASAVLSLKKLSLITLREKNKYTLPNKEKHIQDVSVPVNALPLLNKDSDLAVCCGRRGKKTGFIEQLIDRWQVIGVN